SQLILEPVARPAGASTGWVAALDHEIADHAVKLDAVIEALPRQEDKVIDRLRRVGWVKLYDDLTLVGVNRRHVIFGRIDLHRRRSAPLLCSHSSSFLGSFVPTTRDYTTARTRAPIRKRRFFDHRRMSWCH